MGDIHDGTPPHLRPLDQNRIAPLCDEALRIAGRSLTIRMEVEGWRESCTPWDAMRLANALSTHAGTEALVHTLDALAFETAGLKPSNRRPK